MKDFTNFRTRGIDTCNRSPDWSVELEKAKKARVDFSEKHRGLIRYGYTKVTVNKGYDTQR